MLSCGPEPDAFFNYSNQGYLFPNTTYFGPSISPSNEGDVDPNFSWLNIEYHYVVLMIFSKPILVDYLNLTKDEEYADNVDEAIEREMCAIRTEWA